VRTTFLGTRLTWTKTARYNSGHMWNAAPVATDTRDEFAGLFSVYFWVLVVTGAIVSLVVVFALVRYRRRSGRAPSRRSEAKIVEILYAGVLAAVVSVLVWKTFGTERKVDALAARGCERIQVTAFQWGWRFTYPDRQVTVVGNQNAPPAAAVPVGVPLCFSVRSQDVIHSFWVPDLRFKKDAFPKFTNRFDLVVDRPGAYVGRCAEFCGLQHASMSFQLQGMAEDAFRAWVLGNGGQAP
jgi:cytochrome c oxidase subunit II